MLEAKSLQSRSNASMPKQSGKKQAAPVEGAKTAGTLWVSANNNSVAAFSERGLLDKESVVECVKANVRDYARRLGCATVVVAEADCANANETTSAFGEAMFDLAEDGYSVVFAPLVKGTDKSPVGYNAEASFVKANGITHMVLFLAEPSEGKGQDGKALTFDSLSVALRAVKVRREPTIQVGAVFAHITKGAKRPVNLDAEGAAKWMAAAQAMATAFKLKAQEKARADHAARLRRLKGVGITPEDANAEEADRDAQALNG